MTSVAIPRPLFKVLFRIKKKKNINNIKKKIFKKAIEIRTGFVSANAQTEARVKILPTSNHSVIKLLYAMDTQGLEVKFLHNGELVKTDKIKGKYSKGISKLYDVSAFKRKDFYIEVSSPQMVLTYHVIPSEDKIHFTPYLEKTTYNHVLVRANN